MREITGNSITGVKKYKLVAEFIYMSKMEDLFCFIPSPWPTSSCPQQLRYFLKYNHIYGAIKDQRWHLLQRMDEALGGNKNNRREQPHQVVVSSLALPKEW